MSGAVVSLLLWSVVVVGYACSVWCLGKVWREAPPREAVARPSVPRRLSSQAASGHPGQGRDRRARGVVA
jgi:hypothetical protein